jgi:hypothetical protein
MKQLGRPPVDPVIRFKSKLKEMESGCIEFTGGKDNNGYGHFYISEKINTVKAHRYSYELHYGKIENNLLVCHKCDNPSCVNPEHLFLGTNKENMQDMVNKGRAAKHQDTHHNAKINSEIVKEIRQYISLGYKNVEIAKIYNLEHKHISLIRNNKRWSWV